MRKKMLALLMITALVTGVSVFAATSVSYAVIINTITVTDTPSGGGGTYIGGPLAGSTWVITPGSINLGTSKSAVFTQNDLHLGATVAAFGLPGLNFDSSEENKGVKATQYSISINGNPLILDTSTGTVPTPGLLNNGGTDIPTSTTKNEAGNWVAIGDFIDPTSPVGQQKYRLFVGYADTLHSDACLDQSGPAGLAGPGCLPWSTANPIWDGVSFGSTAADFFRGFGSNLTGGYPPSGHCDVNNASSAAAYCFDSGAILIVGLPSPLVPEPSSLFLLGISLMGLAAYGSSRRYLRKNS